MNALIQLFTIVCRRTCDLTYLVTWEESIPNIHITHSWIMFPFTFVLFHSYRICYNAIITRAYKTWYKEDIECSVKCDRYVKMGYNTLTTFFKRLHCTHTHVIYIRKQMLTVADWITWRSYNTDTNNKGCAIPMVETKINISLLLRASLV